MKRLGAVLLLLTFALPAMAGTDKQNRVPVNSKLFIDKMDGGLDGYIATELLKQKLPVSITTDSAAADFVLVGASKAQDDKWFHSVFGGQDKHEGSVQLLSVKDKTLVWAGSAGDRSLWWGNLSKGGQRKVAERIVSDMKKQLFKN